MQDSREQNRRVLRVAVILATGRRCWPTTSKTGLFWTLENDIDQVGHGLSTRSANFWYDRRGKP